MNYFAVISTLWLLVSLIIIYAIIKVLFALANYLNSKSYFYSMKSDEIQVKIENEMHKGSQINNKE